jgi:hypothetical protein
VPVTTTTSSTTVPTIFPATSAPTIDMGF